MAITKVSSLASLYNNIYEDSLFVAREANLMVGLVRNFSARGWMTRTVPIYATITAESVAEGVDYTNSTEFSKSASGTLTPGEIATQVILTDREVETDPENAVANASYELGQAIATKIDTDLVGSFSSLNAEVGPGAGSSATIAKAAVGMSVLRNAKAPSPLYAVMHPYHWHDIWVELGQPAATYAFLGELANQAMRDFYVGNMMNMQWFTNANIAVDASDDAVSGIFSPGAMAFDSRKAPTLEPDRDASLRATEMNMTAGYAQGVIRASFGVYYTADAATPS